MAGRPWISQLHCIALISLATGGCFNGDPVGTGDTDDEGSGTSSPSTTNEPTTSSPTTNEPTTDPSSESGDPTGGAGTYCEDADEDGFGNPMACEDFDSQPPGYVDDDTDCDDASAVTFPGAAPSDDAEACMKDQDDDEFGDIMAMPGVQDGSDCDDTTDFTFPGSAPNDDAEACMRDEDDDDWGDLNATLVEVTNGTDCVDTDANAFPGAAPNDAPPNACMMDADGDDWGDIEGPGASVPGTDCDDADEYAFPGAAPNDDAAGCMSDADGDDWGDENPPGTATPGSDCADSDADISPGVAANESCLCTADGDGDGWGDSDPASALVDAGHDCDDANGASAINCGPVCVDSDGDTVSAYNGCIDHNPGDPIPVGTALRTCDCDDGDAFAFPGAAPNDDELACMRDEDLDNWGDIWPPTTEIEPGTDCVDRDNFGWPYLAFSTLPVDLSIVAERIHPEAAENESSMECQLDYDLDGWGSTFIPTPNPAYPFIGEAWIEAGSDSDDTNALVN